MENNNNETKKNDDSNFQGEDDYQKKSDAFDKLIRNNFSVFRFKEPSPTFKSPEELNLHNLKIADEYHYLEFFVVAMRGWFHLHPGCDYQDFERYLRQNNFNTHIIADRNYDKELYTLQHPDKQLLKEGLLYKALISCRSSTDCIKELQQHWEDYSKNFEALKFSGDLCSETPEKLNQDKRVQKISDNPLDPIQKLTKNQLQIVCEFDFENFKKAHFEGLKQIREKFRFDGELDFNEEPKIQFQFSTIHTGPVYAFVLNNFFKTRTCFYKIGEKYFFCKINETPETLYI